MLSKSKEDYLETIFHLESEGRTATTNEIAEHMKVSQASASEALKKLSEEKLVVYSPHKGVKLNAEGKRAAADVVRRHRLSERFLVDKLGVKWEDVHEEAHKLEHGISKIVENKLYELLKEPETCPHGNPIPKPNGKIIEEPSYQLSTFKKDDKVEIIKITEEDSKMLCYLATLGLMPKTRIIIGEKAPFDGPIMIKLGQTTYAIGRKIADSIWGKKI